MEASPETAASVLSALLSRRYSCRAFRSEPVPRAAIEAVLAMAQRTPSWCNTQPWEVAVVSGEALGRLTADLYAAAAAGAPGQPEFPFPPEYQGVYRDRRKVCGVQLYQSLGIGRDDRARAREQTLENFRCFGAPHALFLTTDETLGFYGGLDCGLYLMSLILAFEAHGIATIPQAALASYPEVVRRHVPLGAGRRLLCGLSFGHAEAAHPVNGYRTGRAGLDDVVRWFE